MAPPDFGRSVNPISTRGRDYALLITTGTPGFSDLLTTPSTKAAPGLVGGLPGPHHCTAGLFFERKNISHGQNEFILIA